MCQHAFSFLSMPWHSLAIMPSQLPLHFLQHGNPKKSYFNYNNNLTKLQLLQLDWYFTSILGVYWRFKILHYHSGILGIYICNSDLLVLIYVLSIHVVIVLLQLINCFFQQLKKNITVNLPIKYNCLLPWKLCRCLIRMVDFFEKVTWKVVQARQWNWVFKLWGGLSQWRI